MSFPGIRTAAECHSAGSSTLPGSAAEGCRKSVVRGTGNLWQEPNTKHTFLFLDGVLPGLLYNQQMGPWDMRKETGPFGGQATSQDLACRSDGCHLFGTGMTADNESSLPAQISGPWRPALSCRRRHCSGQESLLTESRLCSTCRSRRPCWPLRKSA